jgi:hypothetical protein
MELLERITDLEFATFGYDKLPLECDGLTRVLSNILKEKNIDHKVFCGEVQRKDEVVIQFHMWIEVDDIFIDYRLRMWLGDNPPHGVFQQFELDKFDLTYSNKKEINFNSSKDKLVAKVLMGFV